MYLSFILLVRSKLNVFLPAYFAPVAGMILISVCLVFGSQFFDFSGHEKGAGAPRLVFVVFPLAYMAMSLPTAWLMVSAFLVFQLSQIKLGNTAADTLNSGERYSSYFFLLLVASGITHVVALGIWAFLPGMVFAGITTAIYAVVRRIVNQNVSTI